MGMDIEGRFKLADEKMKKAESEGQLFGIIAQVLLDLYDSHTRLNRKAYSTGRIWRLMKPLGRDSIR